MLQMDSGQTYEIIAVGSIVSPGDLQIHKSTSSCGEVPRSGGPSDVFGEPS